MRLFLFIILLVFLNGCATRNKSSLFASVEYDGERVDLVSPLRGGDGWRSVDFLASEGSHFKSIVVWGGKWYETIQYETQSSYSTNPFETSSREREDGALTAEKIVLGQIRDSLKQQTNENGFNIEYSRQEFLVEGAVTIDGKLRRGSEQLSVGDRFQMGSTIEFAMIRWPLSIEVPFRLDGDIGFGWGRISTLGIRGVNPLADSNSEFEFGLVEQVREDDGFVVDMTFNLIGIQRGLESFFFRFPVLQYMNTSDDELGYLKYGSEVAFSTAISSNLAIHGNIGAYDWRVTSAGVRGFDSAQSTLGVTLGLGLEYVW